MQLQKHQQLLWLEEMEKRKGLTTSEQRELKQMQAGFNGEEYFGKYMRNFIPKDWILLQDLRLKTINGEIQIDAILITNLGLTLFEVKNYSADYHYNDGRWKVNGKVKYHNDFLQLDRTVGLLRFHMQQHGINIPVDSFVVYINEEDSVEIDDPTLPFIKHAKLGRFVKNTLKDCQQAPTQTYHRETEWLISQHQVDERRLSLTDDRFATIQKGVHCVACNSFDIAGDRYHIYCNSCQFSESKEKAIIRTICDYGILFPFRNLSVPDLMTFLSPNTNYNTLFLILKRHFHRKSNSNHYINRQLNYNAQFPELTFRFKDRPLSK